MLRKTYASFWLMLLAVLLGGVLMAPAPGVAKLRTCPPFPLKDAEGKVINPVTGENANQPYSSRQTCGSCHNYDEITKGYHFQQGWERVRDDFRKDKPWVLSDGMMGKH